SAIVDNAVRYTTSGKIRIEASMERRDGNIPHFLLSVADTGKGIAPEDQGRIFSPFVQLESEGPGAGIGLSLARNIVRALGGEVRLESTLGRGSVFTILLPSGEPNEVKPSASPASGPRVYRLLVVDDNEVNLEYMAALLRNAGHRVDTAQNGAEALSLAEEHCPDAAILDIQMPGMNGIELERRIRSATGGRYDPGLPLIALTAFDPKEISSSGARFCAVFSKPFDARNLAEALDKGIAASEAAAFSLGTSSRGHLLVAAEDLPDYMASLERALVGREAEAFRSDAQQLALRLETLGAEGAAAAFRRLALALAWEDEVVSRSRLERYQAAWESSLGQGLSTP
ncbi:MAG: response regulator, partial [Holophaga sp.]|nr:response regulator [Holophaga sp.]